MHAGETGAAGSGAACAAGPPNIAVSTAAATAVRANMPPPFRLRPPMALGSTRELGRPAPPAAALLGAIGIATDSSLAVAVALVWVAHIGMDRMCGFGLKYDTDFGDTHLGRIGKPGGSVG